MVRTYSRKTKEYTDDDVKHALQKVKDGQSVPRVSQASGIPQSSLYHHINLHKIKKKDICETCWEKISLK